MPWLFALMVYIAGLAGIGLVLLDDGSRGVSPLATTLTLQVPAGASKARLETVLAVLRQTPGVVSAQLLAAAETARLIAPWLGPAAPLDELPVPRLIDVRIDPNGATDLAALRRHLASVVPDARLDDQRELLAGMLAAAHHIDAVLVLAIVVALSLIGLSTVFAVGAGFAGNRAAIELLLLLGAADRDIVRPLAMRWLRLGLSGGAIGGGAALLTIVTLRDAGSVVRLPARGGELADWRIWAALSGAALAAGLVALLSARAAVQRRLAQMP